MAQSLVGQFAISGVGVAFVLVGLYTMNKGRVERAQSGRIAATETTPVGELQLGTVEVKGTARLAADADAVASPITEQEALATAVEVEQWESSGQGGGSWETKHEAQRAAPITVDDGTGEVRVRLPPDGELDVDATRTTVEAGEEPPERIARYLETEAAVDEPSRHEFGPLRTGERRRYSEGVLEAGEDVYVLGAARETESGPAERSYVVDQPTDVGDFILSNKSEETLVREGKRGGLVSLAFGGVLVVAGLTSLVAPWIAA